MTSTFLANVVLPSLFGHQFIMFCSLLIVISIESYIISRYMKISYQETLTPCSKANIISTLLGFPIGYFGSYVFFALLTIIFSPFSKKFPIFTDACHVLASHSMFMGGMVFYEEQFVPLASIFMLIPYYYASVYIEQKCLKKSFPEIDKKNVYRAVIMMNRVTYTIIGLLLLGIFFWNHYRYCYVY